ncbi:MAG: peptidoglycan DD-metalloendopeptidase family protein [Vicingaceae bacterium]
MIIYLLKSLLLSAILIGIYYLLLRNSGQCKFNRFYLLAAIILTVCWPAVNFQLSAEEAPLFLEEGTKVIQAMNESTREGFILEPHNPTSQWIWEMVTGLYLSISILLLLRFFLQISRLFHTKAIESKNGQGIYLAKGVAPYSFFNRLYLPAEAKVDEKVIRHEKVHMNQWHSSDICLLELLLCFYWFNPFMYLFRKAVKENHEFLADQGAIENQTDTDYLKLILHSVSKQNHHYLSNPFSYSSIKKRIKMIQNPPKSKSKKSFLLSISLITLSIVLAAFSFKTAKIEAQLNQEVRNSTGIILLKVPKGLPIEKSSIIKIASSFGKRVHPLTKQEKLHKGIDLLAAEGTPILATASGVVKCSKTNTTGYGKHVIIQHNGTYSSLYAHMSALNVKAGEVINEGDTLGIIGTSGTSLSVHLHYEIREEEKAIDPMKFIKLEND